MGEAVVVPDGWWYQSYDDDRTLSVSARYRGYATAAPTSAAAPAATPIVAMVAAATRPNAAPDPISQNEGVEVVDFELVD
eukprot:CAMPEP_0117587242 /NCGR_PEP_ID=MMETSP0784-20121206/69186_1 /TAXON_ID=39447 /ORGANISM="" /LENGTH=79 /DNA_ID=CAMNT_0005388467 /DNA_START=102 /DNA_END=341 /DNA_ORIENTATION=+